ncbi:hypothetical protein SARC_06172 [Sphaeroforma arctica JP610]|uniref:Uncharacterized protein n=1 Tax=Sphaeroforma arctica JP610 TaxID=667725 RepID=A0A0L0FY64_9EUKA|nr:hypothetical protein SARC_06172 [Sphaeroforma arctica JP610]KNC81506.1 hypothetical protein SARC_06172 [Sphaeroforma arctica JP610]|eukprot:XP_014155408.1 hypothetical protein SARC_06172 [Sphaeroforma arctica JP610]
MVAAGATSINILNVAIVCRLRWKSATGQSSGHTLYSASKIIGRDYLVDEGLTQFPFTFGLPDDLVVTHDHAFCSVKWDARLVESDWKPVAFCRFTMSALYYTQMNMGPKVRREIFDGSKSPALLAEVSLSRDVYQEGEPIDIRLAMHKNGAAVRSVTAHITQHVVFEDGTKNSRNQISQTMLDNTKLKHLSKKNRWTKIDAKLGSTCVRTFSCIPRVPEIRDDSTAVQLLRDSNGQQTVLTPSDVMYRHYEIGCS